MRNFWEAFEKRAESPQMVAMRKLNGYGGVAPRTPEDAQIMQAVNLVTLPPDLKDIGAGCFNCVYYRPLDQKTGGGFCINPEINLDVTENMHCAHWDLPGVVKEWEQVDEATQIEPSEEGTFDSMQLPQDPSMQQQGQPQQGQNSAMDEQSNQNPVQPPPPSETGMPMTGNVPQQDQSTDSGIQGEEQPKPKKAKPKEKKTEVKGSDVHIHVGSEKKGSLNNFFKGFRL
jgi:hypothetical protein